jgi:hypothetical protein
LGRVGFDERRSSDTSRYLGSGGAANRIMYDMLEQYMWPGISANRQVDEPVWRQGTDAGVTLKE